MSLMDNKNLSKAALLPIYNKLGINFVILFSQQDSDKEKSAQDSNKQNMVFFGDKIYASDINLNIAYQKLGISPRFYKNQQPGTLKSWMQLNHKMLDTFSLNDQVAHESFVLDDSDPDSFIRAKYGLINIAKDIQKATLDNINMLLYKIR